MAQVKFLFGTLDQYNALISKDENSLYFITDTYQLYKGSNLYTKSYEVAANVSSVGSPKENYVYIFTDEKYFAEYNKSTGAWNELTPRVTDDLSSTNKIPLTQAVKSAIDTIQAAIDLQGETIESHTSKINEYEETLKTLNGEGSGSVVEIAKTAAADVIAEMLADADTDFDTLKEMSDYLKSDKENAAQISNDINALKQEIGLSEDGSSASSPLVERVEQLETTVGSSESSDSLAGRLDVLEEQIEGIISEGGEANLVDDVTINGTSIVENKVAKIVIVKPTGDGHLTINGTDYTIANLGNYVLKETFDPVNTKVSELETTIANLQDADEALDQKITTLSNTVSNNYTTLSNGLNSVNSKIDNIETATLQWGSINSVSN